MGSGPINTKTFDMNEISYSLVNGNLCGQLDTEISGFIADGMFLGEIILKNETLNFENHKKFSETSTKCAKCHGLIYSSKDYINILEGKIIYKSIKPKEIHRNQKYVNITKTISYQDGAKSRKKKYCPLFIWLHEEYISEQGSMNIAFGQINRHIAELNKILALNFKDADGDALLQYHIKSVEKFGPSHSLHNSIHDSEALLEAANKLAGGLDTCSTGVYVNRDWKGVLGLAFVGSDRGSGICNTQATFVVTSKIEYFSTSSKTHMITTIHEISHNLGANHDPKSATGEENSRRIEECHAEKGYIMTPIATSHDNPNHLKLSPCSISNINPVITNKHNRRCLLDFIPGFCGNGIIDKDEQCDSGNSEDKCCGASNSQTPCKLLNSAQCSPSEGDCCSAECEIKSASTECKAATECTTQSICDGSSKTCPAPQNTNENGFCENDAAVCYQGACSKSPCEKLGKKECTCSGEKVCTVCCKDDEKSECKPHNYGTEDSEGEKFLPKGFPCSVKNMGGVCIQNGKCMIIHTVSPIIFAITSFISGSYIDEIKTCLFNSFEIATACFALYITLFSLVSRFLMTDNEKAYMNMKAARELRKKNIEKTQDPEETYRKKHSKKRKYEEVMY